MPASATLTDADLARLSSEYRTHGWCAPPVRLREAAVAAVRERVDRLSAKRRPEVVHEKDSGVVRAVHGCHNFDDLCAALVRMPDLVALAEALLGGPAYVYQFKVNLKQAREGAAWPWHQDFAFWHCEDGMPRPDAVSVAITLDDVHEGNGPLVVVPGSHTDGILDLPDELTRAGQNWRDHVSANLTYTVDDARANALADTNGRQLLLGRAGSIHAFHPNIVHSSSNNLSDDRRALLLITYNRADNAPTSPSRPTFLVDRNTDPVVPQPDDRLLLVGAA